MYLLSAPDCGCASCTVLRDTSCALRGRILVGFTSSKRGLVSLTCCSVIRLYARCNNKDGEDKLSNLCRAGFISVDGIQNEITRTNI